TLCRVFRRLFCFFFQAEDGIRDRNVTGVQTVLFRSLPEDIQQATDADLLLWNGLNMETGDGWFESLTEVAGKEIDSPQVVEVSTGVEPQYLTSSDGQESEINPHAFLSPLVGMVYTENIRDALIEVDPDHEETYTANADTYLDTLDEIDQTYTELVE